MSDDDFQKDIAKAVAALDGFDKKIGWVASEAMNEIGFDIRRGNQSRMDSIFEGGATRFTQNAVVVDKATPDRLQMDLRHLPVQAHYLGLQEEGGVDNGSRPAGLRSVKRLAVPVNANVPKTAQGNLPGGWVQQQAAQNPDEFFIGQPKGYRYFGLWRRVGDGAQHGRKWATIAPYVLFLPQRVYSTMPYRFKQWARDRAEKSLGGTVKKALAREIERFLR